MAVVAYAPSGPGTAAAGGPASASDYGQLAQLNSSLTPAQQAAAAAKTGPGGNAPLTGPGAPVAPAPAVNPYGPAAQNFYAALDNNKYIDAFNTSLGQERANLDQGLWQAMGELGQRRDAAAQYVTKLPGQTAADYQFASGLLNSGNNTAGLAPNLQAQARAQAAPLNSAIAANKSATDALGPFLNLANMANYQSGAAALRQQHMIGENDLNSQKAQFEMEQLKTAAQRAQTQADQQALFAHEDKSEANKEKFQGDQAAIDRAQHEKDLAAQAGQVPSGESSLAGTGLTRGEVDSLRSSGEYARMKAFIANPDVAGRGHGANPAMIAAELGRTNPKLLNLLQHEPSTAAFFKNATMPGAASSSDLWGNLDVSRFGSALSKYRV